MNIDTVMDFVKNNHVNLNQVFLQSQELDVEPGILILEYKNLEENNVNVMYYPMDKLKNNFQNLVRSKRVQNHMFCYLVYKNFTHFVNVPIIMTSEST